MLHCSVTCGFVFFRVVFASVLQLEMLPVFFSCVLKFLLVSFVVFFVVFRVLVLDFRVLGCQMLFCVVVDGFAFFWLVFARVLQLEMLRVFFRAF